MNRILLDHLAIRKLEARLKANKEAFKPQKTKKAIVYYAIYLYVSLRRQQFENQQMMWCLPEATQVRRYMRPLKLYYEPGFNYKALNTVAPKMYHLGPGKRHRTVSCGDATRCARILELLHRQGETGKLAPTIVGEMGHPDITKRKQGGHPVSQRADDIFSYVESVRRRGLVAPEVYTELFVCVTTRDLPILVYMIWAEANKGFTGYLMVKMWLRYVTLWHKYDIDCIGVVTDACGPGVWGGSYMMTPAPWLLGGSKGSHAAAAAAAGPGCAASEGGRASEEAGGGGISPLESSKPF